MDLNARFDDRASVHGAKIPWQASPMAGVERRMLDRMGDEVARATSIVRYAPGSNFSPHVHTGGEEFLVLEGVFQDEHGDYPAGSYIRNPPLSSHTPGSEQGCVIFVKLWQFNLADRTQVHIDTNLVPFETDSTNKGVHQMPLFEDKSEKVLLETWDAGTMVNLSAPNGMEILVLGGGFQEADEEFAAQSWLRLPKNSQSTARTGPSGAKVWIKRGHLSIIPHAPRV